MFHFPKFCGAALVVLGCSIPATAQDAYPSRPIRLVVGFGAGGPTDIPARFIADKLGEAVGHRVRSLHRSRYGPLTLEGLESGRWRELEPSEVERLRSATKRDSPPRARAPGRAGSEPG